MMIIMRRMIVAEVAVAVVAAAAGAGAGVVVVVVVLVVVGVFVVVAAAVFQLVVTLHSVSLYQKLIRILILIIWALQSPFFLGRSRTTPSVWPTPSRPASRARQHAPSDRRSPGPPLVRMFGASGAAGIKKVEFYLGKNGENHHVLPLNRKRW